MMYSWWLGIVMFIGFFIFAYFTFKNGEILVELFNKEKILNILLENKEVAKEYSQIVKRISDEEEFKEISKKFR